MKGLALSLLLALAGAAPAVASTLEEPAGGAERVVPQGPAAAPQLPVQLTLDLPAAPVGGGGIQLAPSLPAASETAVASQNAAAQPSLKTSRPADESQTPSAENPLAIVSPLMRPPGARTRDAASVERALASQASAATELTQKAGTISGENASAQAGEIFREFSAPRSEASPVVARESNLLQRLLPSFARRKEARNSTAPRKPQRTYVRKLIFWNIVVYLLTLPLMPIAAAVFGVVPAHMRAVVWYGSPVGILHAAATSLTSLFIHVNAFHLISNMVGLWLFGRLVERWLGRSSFKKIYYISGVAAALAAALFVHTPIIIIGASTAISGLVGAYVVALFRLRPWVRETDPRRWKRLLAALRNVGLALLAAFGIWMITQNLWLLVAGGPLDQGVYVLGHVVGALAGIGIALRLLRRPTAPAVS